MPNQQLLFYFLGLCALVVIMGWKPFKKEKYSSPFKLYKYGTEEQKYNGIPSTFSFWYIFRAYKWKIIPCYKKYWLTEYEYREYEGAEAERLTTDGSSWQKGIFKALDLQEKGKEGLAIAKQKEQEFLEQWNKTQKSIKITQLYP